MIVTTDAEQSWLATQEAQTLDILFSHPLMDFGHGLAITTRPVEAVLVARRLVLAEQLCVVANLRVDIEKKVQFGELLFRGVLHKLARPAETTLVVGSIFETDAEGLRAAVRSGSLYPYRLIIIHGADHHETEQSLWVASRLLTDDGIIALRGATEPVKRPPNLTPVADVYTSVVFARDEMVEEYRNVLRQM